MIGQYQRERAGHEARNPVCLDVNGVAEAELHVGKELAPIRVEHDVLRGREKRDGRGEIRDRPQVELRLERAEQRDRGEQQQLRQEHPATAAAEDWQRITINEW